MFGPLAYMKLKAAQEALEGGRLEEAFRTLAAADIRGHPRSRELLEQIARAYLDRVRAHEQAGRYSEALLDLDRAAAAGAARQDVENLRAWITGLAERAQKAATERREQIERARERIEAGSLATGRELLAGLDASDSLVRELHREADTREQRAARARGESEELLAAGRIGPACRAWERARSENPKAEGLVELEARLVQEAYRAAIEALVNGRLEVASDLLRQLGDVGRDLPERIEHERAVADIRTAAEAIDRADWPAARCAVLRLKARIPDATWIADAAERLDQIEEIVTALRAGPLGTLVRAESPAGSAEPDGPVEAPRTAAPPVQAPPRLRPTEPTLGHSWRLLVDGAGSYLMIRRDRVTIGRAGGAEQPDVALQADISSCHAEILRVEDDYFLLARRPVAANGRVVSQKLLEDGDRIELSRHARLTFRLPSRRSPSAVLELHGSLRLPGDVRRVVLFDRHVTIGPGPANHIVVPQAMGTVAVFERAGRLHAQPAAGPDGPYAPPVRLVQAETVEVGGIRMVMTMR